MNKTALLFLSFIIEAIVLWQYTSKLFIPKHSAKTRVLFLSALYFALFIFSLFQNLFLNMILFLGANLLFFTMHFSLKFSYAFFHASILTVAVGLSELAVMAIFIRPFPHFLSTDYIGLFLYCISSKSLYFTVIYFFIQLFERKRKIPNPHDSSELFLILIPFSSTFVAFTFIKICATTAFVPPVDIIVTISSFLLLLINLLTFGINEYNQKRSQEYTNMQLMLQKESDSAEYYEMLLSQTENQSILIHDIKKHLQSIRLLNEKNESAKIDAYIQQLMDSSDLKETAKICDNEMLNAILCRYQRQCNNKNISFHADIRRDSVRNIYHHDMTALFCNLLDNAVEATENIPDSFIELTVQKKENSPFILIILINSCRSAPVYDQDELPISNKADKNRHGFGIKSIKKVVKQYNGNLQMYYDNDSATFHTIITLSR